MKMNKLQWQFYGDVLKRYLLAFPGFNIETVDMGFNPDGKIICIITVGDVYPTVRDNMADDLRTDMSIDKNNKQEND